LPSSHQITGGDETGREDHYLRYLEGVKREDQGGPSNKEFKEQFEAKGMDYELALNRANRHFGVQTRYNPDGTVSTKVVRSPKDLPSMEEVEQPERSYVTKGLDNMRTYITGKNEKSDEKSDTIERQL